MYKSLNFEVNPIQDVCHNQPNLKKKKNGGNSDKFTSIKFKCGVFVAVSHSQLWAWTHLANVAAAAIVK